MSTPDYNEVHPKLFEDTVSKVPQGFIDQDRKYEGTRTYLSDKGTSGYAIAPDGEVKYVFSTEKGHGRLATRHAVAQGGTHANTFDSPVSKLLESEGWSVYHREPNWEQGKPDVLWLAAPGKTPPPVKTVTKPDIVKSLKEKLLKALRNL